MKSLYLNRARWPWPRIGLLAIIALAMWGLKRHYAAADVAELAWILKPVASLCAWVSGVQFEWEPGAGYLSREHLFVIAKPCAGVNFMLAALALVGLVLSKRAVSWRASASVFVVSIGLAYAATVMANTGRIAVALWLAAHPLASDFWTAARIHRVEGIAVYFGMLVVLHVLVQRLAKIGDEPRARNEASDSLPAFLRQARIPLASYYLVTILIPLANGSADNNHAFFEHMAFVVLAPLALVVLFALLRAAWQRTA